RPEGRRLVGRRRRPLQLHLGHVLRDPLPEEGDAASRRRERGPEGSMRNAALVLLLLAGASWAQEDPKGVEFFEKKIRPVLTDKCYSCHSAQAEKLKGSLYLDTRDGLLKGGDTGPAIVA